ncbi:MAG: cupin [Synechococcaceae cyanobacterium]
MTQAPSSHSTADWQSKARLYDYRQAANPVRAGLTEPIGYRSWDPQLHATGPSAVIPLDLSAELGCPGPATSPGLAAHFLRLVAGEGLKAACQATSSLFYVLEGSGSLRWSGRELSWSQGDLIALPCGDAPLLEASSTSVLYWVHDGPLLQHLGVEATTPRFEATHYPAALLEQELQQLLADPSAAHSNRLSLLLANADLPASRTVTHTLWAMLGVVPEGAVQPPHRHQSVALDLIIDCDPGCYTLVGTELDARGRIRNPERIDWQPGGAFITPPGHWHAHVNASGRMARLLPIQDAGLHTYLRSLDIRFSGTVRD